MLLPAVHLHKRRCYENVIGARHPVINEWAELRKVLMEETKLMNMAIAKLMLLCCTLHCVWVNCMHASIKIILSIYQIMQALPTQQSDNTTRKMCTDECQQRGVVFESLS